MIFILIGCSLSDPVSNPAETPGPVIMVESPSPGPVNMVEPPSPGSAIFVEPQCPVINDAPIVERATEFVTQQLAIMKANPAPYCEPLGFTEDEITGSEIGNPIRFYLFDESGEFSGSNSNNLAFPLLYLNEIIGIIEVAYLPGFGYCGDFSFTFGKSYGNELNSLVSQHVNNSFIIGNLETRLLFAIIGEKVSVFKCNFGETELTEEQIENILTTFHAAVENPEYFRFTRSRTPRSVIVNAQAAKPAADDFGVTLEYVSSTPNWIYLVMTNHTDHDIRYANDYEIVGKQWGSAGAWDDVYKVLPSGGKCDVIVELRGISPGEYRLKKSIIVSPGDINTAENHAVYAEFVIENTSIPADFRDVVMKVDQDFAAPIGAMVEITNGFDSGLVFFDKSFLVQRNTDGEWQDIPTISSDNFTNDTTSMAPRQVWMFSIYWAWLYGELPPGEYRIGKCFLHRADNGKETQYILYSTFMLDGEPIPDHVIRNGSHWRHPWHGTTSFRAKVMEVVDPEWFFDISFGISCLLVNALSSTGDGSLSDNRYFVRGNDLTIAIDINGEHMRFSDIPQGAIVDMTFNGMVLLTDPGQIGVHYIRIVEEK